MINETSISLLVFSICLLQLIEPNVTRGAENNDFWIQSSLK